MSNLFKCDLLYSCAAAHKIRTDRQSHGPSAVPGNYSTRIWNTFGGDPIEISPRSLAEES